MEIFVLQLGTIPLCMNLSAGFPRHSACSDLSWRQKDIFYPSILDLPLVKTDCPAMTVTIRVFRSTAPRGGRFSTCALAVMHSPAADGG